MHNRILIFLTAIDRLSVFVAGNSTAFAVILRTTEKSVWANEFECKSHMMLFN